MDLEKKYWIALSHFPKFGPIRFKKLENYFSCMEEAYNAKISELIDAGIEKSIADEFVSFRIGINIDNIIYSLEKDKISVVLKSDDSYPRILRELYNPPPIIYYRGDIDCLDKPGIAIVGSRKSTNYGSIVTEKISAGLAVNHINVISGLAVGIDTIAHKKCLESGGKTIAVIGSGIDDRSLYPATNLMLAKKIADSGIVLSEFPPGTPPLKINFPQRNRLISGLSVGVIVVEAGDRSGSLITAGYALEQNREVFAVPGNIFSPLSYGTNKLIKMGARPVTELSDILDLFHTENKNNVVLPEKKQTPDTKEEALILQCLSHEPIGFDEIIRITKLDTSKINSTLTIMEVKGMIKNIGSGEYVLVA